LISDAVLQFAGHPFETICKYRGQSVAAAAQASISREFVLAQERDDKKLPPAGTLPDCLSAQVELEKRQRNIRAVLTFMSRLAIQARADLLPRVI